MPHVYHGVTNELGGTYSSSEYQYFCEGRSSRPELGWACGWACGKCSLGGQSSAAGETWCPLMGYYLEVKEGLVCPFDFKRLQ